MSKEKIGSTRYVIEYVPATAVLREARAKGFGEDTEQSIYDLIEIHDLQEDRVASSLEDAVEKAKKLVESGKHFGGCVVVRRDVLSMARDDLGNIVDRRHLTWEVDRYYEIDESGVVNEYQD